MLVDNLDSVKTTVNIIGSVNVKQSVCSPLLLYTVNICKIETLTSSKCLTCTNNSKNKYYIDIGKSSKAL